MRVLLAEGRLLLEALGDTFLWPHLVPSGCSAEGVRGGGSCLLWRGPPFTRLVMGLWFAVGCGSTGLAAVRQWR